MKIMALNIVGALILSGAGVLLFTGGEESSKELSFIEQTEEVQEDIIKTIEVIEASKVEKVLKTYLLEEPIISAEENIDSVWEEGAERALVAYEKVLSLEFSRDNQELKQGVLTKICNEHKQGDNKEVIEAFIWNRIIHETFERQLASCLMKNETNMQTKIYLLDRLLTVDHQGADANLSSYARLFIFESDELKAEIYEKIKNSPAYNLEMTVNTQGKSEDHEEILDKQLRKSLFDEPSGFGA